MSKETARAFFASVRDDSQVTKQFENLEDPAKFFALAVRTGSEHGFELSAEDVRDLLEERTATGELTDVDLEGAVGGTLYAVNLTASCTTMLTLGCAWRPPPQTGGCLL